MKIHSEKLFSAINSNLYIISLPLSSYLATKFLSIPLTFVWIIWNLLKSNRNLLHQRFLQWTMWEKSKWLLHWCISLFARYKLKCIRFSSQKNVKYFMCSMNNEALNLNDDLSWFALDFSFVGLSLFANGYLFWGHSYHLFNDSLNWNRNIGMNNQRKAIPYQIVLLMWRAF